MHDRRGRQRVPAAHLPALLLVVASAAGACGTTTRSPVGTPAGTAAPTAAQPANTATPAPPSPVSTAVSPPCTEADLKASHGRIEGAAGSIFTEVLLVSAAACSVDAFPALGLRDATGAAVLGGHAAGPGRIDLVAGAGYASEVRLANWCAPEPAFPLTLGLRLGAEELSVEGGSFPEDGNLPPCNGEGAPILEGGAWTLRP